MGSLLYIRTYTRSDATFSINILSQFVESLQEVHWSAAMGVLMYLFGSPGQENMIGDVQGDENGQE